jgi:hypothetical protein
MNWIADEFSVGGETLVKIHLPDGTSYDIPIAELYEMCEGNPVQEDLSLAIREAFVAGQLKVTAVSVETGAVGLHPVTEVLQHKCSHKIAFRLCTQGGHEVVASEDHSLFLIGPQGGSLRETCTKDIRVGDELAAVQDEVLVGLVVESIQEVEPREYMYDLSVPEVENFVLTNGIVAHNSYSIGGISLDIDKSSKYQGMKDNAEQQFTKATDAKLITVKFIRGLQQPKFGFGIRSSFGPNVGRGILSPRSFV